MVENLLEEERSKMKLVSVYNKDLKIVKDKLNYFGDFSGFVRWCLRNEKLVEKYLQEKKQS